MNTITIQINTTEKNSIIITDSSFEALIANVLPFVSGRKVLIITDENVAPLYLDKVKSHIAPSVKAVGSLIIPAGEASKNIMQAECVLSALIAGSFTRSDLIIALGGGVITDIGGFAAAVYKRGMDYINIPTTLLGMIDSSIGGKTAVDFGGIKNSVGAFHQPSYVLCAIEFLKTLPTEEYRSGIGELIKYQMLSGIDFAEKIKKNGNADENVIADCIRIKAGYVSIDQYDNNDRRLLNLGHTFGHAFEEASGYTLRHGEAVMLGLIAEMRFGSSLGIVEADAAKQTEALVKMFYELPEYRSFASAAGFVAHDKKSEGDLIEMAFVSDFGKPFLKKVDKSDAVEFLKNYTVN